MLAKMNLACRMKLLFNFYFLIGFTILEAQQNMPMLDIQLVNYDYGFPSKTLKIETQKQVVEMSYMLIKPENFNGKYIMLLHGKNFNGAYWKTTIQALSQKGFGVIVPDQIGFGKSTKPLHFQYTFQELAKNTKLILEKENIDKVSVLGHSMGGMLATRFALMYPETVDKFILENPIGLEDWKLKVPYRPVNFWYEYELKANVESLKKYQQINYYDNQWKSEYDESVNILAGWTLNSQYPIIAWNNALTFEMIFTQPVVYEFSNIKNKTLLIIGTRDRTVMASFLVAKDVAETMGRYDILGKTTQKAIPNSQLVEIPNVGHLPHIEAFDKFITPLLHFLAQ